MLIVRVGMVVRGISVEIVVGQFCKVLFVKLVMRLCRPENFYNVPVSEVVLLLYLFNLSASQCASSDSWTGPESSGYFPQYGW